MKEAKFTKGEWKATPDKWDDCHVTSTERAGMVEICKISSVYFDDEDKNDFEIEQIANAHLIAAAPEMYELLKDMVDSINCGDEHGLDSEWHVEASRVLAKARGE